MRICRLRMKNIGPFVNADIHFGDDKQSIRPVTLITGENGTGKSIILDAIRSLFGQHYTTLERKLSRRGAESSAAIKGNFVANNKAFQLTSQKFFDTHVQVTESPDPRPKTTRIRNYPPKINQGEQPPRWVVDYWPSVLAVGSYDIKSMSAPEHRTYLLNSLSGMQKKADITQLICHFDYLRDSRDPDERRTGDYLFEKLERIVELSLLDGGKFSHVARATYEPIVIQNGMEVSLPQLSSGNSYLIQDMIGLLGKMYAVQYLRQEPIEELCNTPGLLLIDEAENQLHPKWQKRFIGSILEIFPNMQIVATTHSPFIISSVDDPKLFVCKPAETRDRCTIEDITAEYTNKPVDEILMSPLFEGTQPFNQEITQLIQERKAAIEADDESERARIERKLKELNPEYFSYFDLDQLIQDLTTENA